MRYNSAMAPAAPSAAHAFRATLDLFHLGLELMEQNLRRQHPQASEQEIEQRLYLWLRERPGAEAGDSSGTPVDVDARLG